jgi:hypothetical protein
MTTSTTSRRSVSLVMRSLLRRTGRGSGPGRKARQDCDETRQAVLTPGGQAPDQASSSNRAGAGDHERTSRSKAQQPVTPWVTLAVTNPQPTTIRLQTPSPQSHRRKSPIARVRRRVGLTASEVTDSAACRRGSVLDRQSAHSDVVVVGEHDDCTRVQIVSNLVRFSQQCHWAHQPTCRRITGRVGAVRPISTKPAAVNIDKVPW